MMCVHKLVYRWFSVSIISPKRTSRCWVRSRTSWIAWY